MEHIEKKNPFIDLKLYKIDEKCVSCRRVSRNERPDSFVLVFVCMCTYGIRVADILNWVMLQCLV